MADVVTGEAVALELRLAKLPSRILAALIDFAVQGALFVLFGFFGGFVLAGAGGTDDAVTAALVVVLVVGVLIGYPVLFETLSRGRTLGKLALGLRVVRDDGGPITFRHALVRGLFAGLLEKPGVLWPITSAVGVIVMLCSRQGKRIGDFAAGTVVLQERVPAGRGGAGDGAGIPIAMPPALAGWAQTLDLTRVDDSLALSARQFLGRAGQLHPAARADLGRRLAAEMVAVTTPPPPPGTPEWAYLSAVLAERRRRHEARYAARPPADTAPCPASAPAASAAPAAAPASSPAPAGAEPPGQFAPPR